MENVGVNSPGKVRVSKNIYYQDETVNKSKPYIENYKDTIIAGFGNCSTLKIGSNIKSRFSGDTVILNYYVSLVASQGYSIVCKYKR